MVKETFHINKNVYRSLLVISFVVINALVIFGISEVLSYFKTGAKRSSMLHLEVKNKNSYLPKVSWGSLENPGRPIETQTLQEIQEDYLDSWYIKNVAYKTNDSTGINDFYTDSTRVNLFEFIKFNKKNKIQIETTSISHHPEIEFYSADGQLVIFTDKKVKEFERFFYKDRLLSEQMSISDYRVMMLLEDGFWRVRHLVKNPTASSDSIQNFTPFLHIKEDMIYENDTLFHIKGINYYPQKNPWDLFGDKFDEKVINDDFKIISNAGLNTVRIFIQYEDFGKAEVLPPKLEKLKKILDSAENNNLKVVITLFDFYGDYSILDWTLTHRHAEKIVTAMKEHRAILAWDLKNEPDLDFKSRGKETVLAWLKEMAWQIKSYDPNHLITVGWFDSEAAVLLKDEVDFISYHYYGASSDFEKNHQKLKKYIPNKPLVLQEFGMSSYSGLWNLYGSSEKDQATYHQRMQAVIKKNNLQFVSWTLYDFNEIPKTVIGRLPWRKNKQKYFGFIDIDGNKKPSFKHINSN